MLAYGRARRAVSQKLYREKITSRIPKVPHVYLRLKWYEYGLQFYRGVGVLLAIPGGGAPHGSPNPDTISDQKYVILLTCFQTRPPKSIPVFRPVLWARDLAFRQKLRHHYLDSVCKQKNSSNAFQVRIFLLLSYSFGIETISTFIHSHSTLENHT